MPKRQDIRSVLVIGSGPIVIGQACEFDYSGTQACRALSAEGYRVVLVNSNPATIMTDPEVAARTYIEPLVPEILEAVIAAASATAAATAAAHRQPHAGPECCAVFFVEDVEGRQTDAGDFLLAKCDLKRDFVIGRGAPRL